MSRPALARRLPALALAALLLHGCGKTSIGTLVPNQPPTVRFTLAPVSADPDDPVFYAYQVFWAGDDPDGRVDHFDYAVDPGPGDTVWVSTTRSAEILFFRSTTDDGKGGPVPHARDYHVLVLRAVDNQGAMSARKMRAFYSYTVAPSVEVVAPHPSGLLEVQVPPSFSVSWQGADPDGQIASRPVRYRFRLLPFDPVQDQWMVSDRDSLFRHERAAGFAGWDSTGGDTTFAVFTNLTPRNHYLFLIVALDEAGALSPMFSLDENMLRLECNPAATLGPRIHVWNSYLDFTYDSGGYTVDELRWIRLDAPADRPIPFNWEAFATAGAHIERYRWGVDLPSVADETPRSDEQLDYHHWSRGGALERSCTLVGLTPGLHLLYIEAKDNNGYASLGIVAFTLVVATLDHELLVVDDTRFEVDNPLSTGCFETYKKPWPSAAELDTFLYARGGVPWRCTQRPELDPHTVPGVFAGYDFDTLGTYQGRADPSLGVRLAELGHYRHVVWMVDARAPDNTQIFRRDGPPITVLRYSSAPDRASNLGAYVQSGGQVWLMGGGAGTASIVEFNSKRNDDLSQVYSNEESELVPGRLMYDGAHWQSAFSTAKGFFSVHRSPAAEAIAAAPWTHPDRWTGGELRSPDYLRLPAEMRYRDPGTDPLPPTRKEFQKGLYYPTTYPCEYLFEPLVITEDINRRPAPVRIASTLDTLMDVSGFTGLRRSPAPTMTYYHGAEANRFVFTGFAPWDFRRDDAIVLTDFVLQDIWGLRREPVDRGLAGGGAAVRPGAPSARGARGTAGARAVK